MVVGVGTKTGVKNGDESASYAKNSGRFRQIKAKSGVDGQPMGSHGQSLFAHGWAKIVLPTVGSPWVGSGQTSSAHGLPMLMSTTVG